MRVPTFLRARNFCVAFAFALQFSAFAHDPGLSTLMATVKGEKVETVTTFARKDIENLMLTIGANPNGEAITMAELEKLAPKIVSLECNGQSVQPTSSGARFVDANNIEFQSTFPLNASGSLKISSSVMDSLPRGHREYFSATDGTGRKLAERMLSAATPGAEFNEATEASTQVSFFGFLKLGVEHILTGYDHLLFLFGLLLVTPRFSTALKIISCFTVAHSITLAAATLNLVKIPSSIVEPTIAASIAYVGLENVFKGGMPQWRWVLTFVFGLVHGLGFASALRELGVGSGGSAIAIPLLSFNLGVELGQLAVTALVLPVLWTLRQNPVFVRRWIPACSIAVALAGGFWFVQRVAF